MKGRLPLRALNLLNSLVGLYLSACPLTLTLRSLQGELCIVLPIF